MRLRCIACEVLFREICRLSSVSPNTIDHTWISQGLHDQGAEKMSARLQQEIDAVPADACEAVLLGYALCNNGVVGLTARHVPLVVPRAHDCITLYLGSREAYDRHFADNPGTYYLTSGWIERDEENLEDLCGPEQDLRLGDMSDRELAEMYGAENVDYLRDMLGDPVKHYNRIAYIDMGFEDGLPFADQAREAAAARGWDFDLVPGDLDLLRRLLDGPWDDDFVVVPPDQTISADYGGRILRCDACPQGRSC